jgi:hypothetical protein
MKDTCRLHRLLSNEYNNSLQWTHRPTPSSWPVKSLYRTNFCKHSMKTFFLPFEDLLIFLSTTTEYLQVLKCEYCDRPGCGIYREIRLATLSAEK